MNKLKQILENNYLIFLFLGLLVLIDRVALLVNFNFNFTGSDDLIFWQSATDYMNGIFHEPYFYGQNYNFMLESLFAIPFIKLGIPYNYSFPIATSIIALFPFFLFAILLFRKGFIIESLFFLFIPVVLPIEYGILTSITRGFVSGLFFSGFLIFCLLNPTKKSSFFILGLSVSLGYIFNPNSVVFALPIGIYMFLKNYRCISFYLINTITVIPLLLMEYYAKRFYVLNPDYNVCGMWNLSFSFKLLMDNFNYLDKFYGFVTPVFWSLGTMVLICLLIFGIMSWKIEWEKGVSIILGLIFLIISLGVNKVNDDLATVFFSSARMFLAIPLLIALAFSWGREKIPLSNGQWSYTLVVMSISIFFVKINSYNAVIKYHTLDTNFAAVAIKKMDDLTKDCSKLAEVASKYKIDLIVFVPNIDFNIPSLEFYDYGCPLLEKQFTKTMLSIGEKRTWVYLKEKTAVNKNILIFGSDIDKYDITNNTNCEIISTAPNMVIIRDNKIPTEELLNSFFIDMKRNWFSETKAKKRKYIFLKAFNNKYVCADGLLNNLVVANRDTADIWERFSIIPINKNKCAIRAYNQRFFSVDLNNQSQITATIDEIADWETFTMIKLDSNRVAFKAVNGKYLSVDEKSFQLSAKEDFIGKQEKFEMIIR